MGPWSLAVEVLGRAFDVLASNRLGAALSRRVEQIPATLLGLSGDFRRLWDNSHDVLGKTGGGQVLRPPALTATPDHQELEECPLDLSPSRQRSRGED